MKKISVITVNYNNAAGLEQTVKSVLDQSYQNFEYIVVDGGSTDGSVNILEQYKDKFRWTSEKDEGMYFAMNKGIKAAKGEFLLFLNSGDFFCDNRVLERVMSYGLDCDIVYGNMMINWGNGKITPGKMPKKISVEHMYKDTLWHPVSFIKKSLFLTLGLYDVSYKMVADYAFFFKSIIANKATTKHIPVFIAEYSTDGFSSKPEYKSLERDERKRVQELYLSKDELLRLQKQSKEVKSSRILKLFNLIKRKR